MDIIHIIDPKVTQGFYSSYSDSQTISPGGKLSHEEMLRREKKQAGILLDKLLSREASRLNYPLKINRSIEVDNHDTIIGKSFKSGEDSILLINKDYQRYHFQDLKEILNILDRYRGMGLFILAGEKFVKFKNILYLSGFSSDEISMIIKLRPYIDKYSPLFNAIKVEREKMYLNVELQSKGWKKGVKNILEDVRLYTNVLTADDESDAVEDYLEKNSYDLFISPKHKNKDLLPRVRKNRNIEFIQSVHVPLLYISNA